MTVVKDTRDSLDIARELKEAICGKDVNDLMDDSVIYHENTNALEIKEARTFNMETEKKPLHTEEEIFAMLLEQRR